MSDLSTEVRGLRERVDQLQRMLVGTYSLLIAVVLVMGLVLPYSQVGIGTDRQRSWSVLSTVLTPLEEDPGAGETVFRIAMIWLIVVTVMILAGTLIPAAMGALTDGLRILGIVLVTLGIVGAVVVLGIAIVLHTQEIGEFREGGFVLLFGMIGVLPLVSRSARSLVLRH